MQDKTNWMLASANLTTLYDNQIKKLNKIQGQAQVLETQRESRGALLSQGGVNEKAKGAGGEAIRSENLLARNINQELTGRIAANTEQAGEALKGIDRTQGETLGRQAARAGQAGYSAESGTAGALADAARSRSKGDKEAIEGLRIGRQNLLMSQGEAATKAAETLTGTINKTTADWADKSTSAIGDVTGTLLTNVQRVAGTEGMAGPGVEASKAAVDSTLGTWSLESYMEVLDTLSKGSANKSTWDQMLIEQGGTPSNPYSQFDAAISPLTPIAGTKSNLLAAAAGAPDVYTSPLSGTKKNSGSLI